MTTAELTPGMRAIELLGAQGILVGISSGVAQTMTSLGVDMGKLVIRRNLRQALSYCMDRRTSHHAVAGH